MVEQDLDPVTREADFTEGKIDVAAVFGVALEVGDDGEDGDGGGCSSEGVGTGGGDACRTHFRQGSGVGGFVAASDHVDDVGGDSFSDHGGGHSRTRRRGGDDEAIAGGTRARNGVRRSESDAGRKEVRVGRALIDSRPVGGSPLFEGLLRVVGIHLHEAVGGEDLFGDFGMISGIGFDADSGEWGKQHSHVEGQIRVFAIEGLVVGAALLDGADVRSGDGGDATFGKEGLSEDLAGGDVAAAADVNTVDAEVAEFVFVGDEGDVGFVANAVGAEFEFEVDNVFEGRTFAGACAVACADEEAFALAALHLLNEVEEGGGGFFGVVSGADRKTVLAGAESFGGGEVELGAGGVDEEVVGEAGSLAGVVAGGFDFDGRLGALAAAIGVEGYRLGLVELDVLLPVDGGEGKGDMVLTEKADTDPDVGWDPIVGGGGGNHGDVVVSGKPFAKKRGSGVAGNSGSEDYNARHVVHSLQSSGFSLGGKVTGRLLGYWRRGRRALTAAKTTASAANVVAPAPGSGTDERVPLTSKIDARVRELVGGTVAGELKRAPA